MTDTEIIDGILDREGPGTPPYTDPTDKGGRTAWGIAERFHPDLWRPGPPTQDQARARLEQVYVAPWAWMVGLGLDDRLRVQLVDFGVLQGVVTAVRALQRVVGTTVDGVIGPLTQQTLVVRAFGLRHINNELLAERFVLEHADAHAGIGQMKYEDGWDTRVAAFYWM